MAPVRVPIAAGDNDASEARLADAHPCGEREQEALCWGGGARRDGGRAVGRAEPG